MKTLSINEIKNTYPELSLKKICDETKVCYQYVLKASKQPIPNQAYDATAFNFEAVQKIFDKKEIDLSAYDWDQINANQKVFEPINKPEDFSAEDQTVFKIRNDTTTYKTIYTTESHIVFIAEDPNVSTQPRVMNWDTFLHQSPRIITAPSDDQPRG